MSYILKIPGRPIPAVRMTRRSKFANPAAQKYLTYKEAVGWEARRAVKAPLVCKVKVTAHFYVDKNAGDLDNYVKSILDGCNKIAWNDDRQVIELHAYRHQDNNQRAEVEIVEV